MMVDTIWLIEKHILMYTYYIIWPHREKMFFLNQNQKNRFNSVILSIFLFNNENYLILVKKLSSQSLIQSGQSIVLNKIRIHFGLFL